MTGQLTEPAVSEVAADGNYARVAAVRYAT
jgi:hypothetical protein